jgi:hypothetical protein
MTVKELIALLQAVPEDSIILVPSPTSRYTEYFRDAKISVKEVFGPNSINGLYSVIKSSGHGIVFE